MTGKLEKDKAYLETLKAFRLLIDSDYTDGGWLPPSRTMCKRMDISSVTYVKATNRLLEEHVAESFPRKGIYIVPEKYRPHKIGVLIGAGVESPFLGGRGMFAATLQHMETAGFCPHLIQGSPITNIPRNALCHYVSGLIWLLPAPQAFPVIHDIHTNRLLPIITVLYQTSLLDGHSTMATVPTITEDGAAVTARMVDLLKRRRHRKILFIGDLWFTTPDYFSEKLKAIGIPFDPGDLISYSMLQSPDFAERLRSGTVTGIISEGTERWHELLFRHLSAIPRASQPEILVRNRPSLKALLKEHPTLRLMGVSDGSMKEWGALAAETMVAHLRTGKPLSSRQIATYRITEKQPG